MKGNRKEGRRGGGLKKKIPLSTWLSSNIHSDAEGPCSREKLVGGGEREKERVAGSMIDHSRLLWPAAASVASHDTVEPSPSGLGEWGYQRSET